MPKPAAQKTLESLAPGQSGIILTIGNERGAVKRRLIDMGITPGTTVTVKKIAPFGDPIKIHLRGYELSLRKADAAQITLGGLQPERVLRPAAAGFAARPLPPETIERMKRAGEREFAQANQFTQANQFAQAHQFAQMNQFTQANQFAQAHELAQAQQFAQAHELAHAHEQTEHPYHYDQSAHDTRKMSIALAGNPNSGKTTLFNALTGANQYVGNWPGVTVEKKEGTAEIAGRDVIIVDLPGIYSLSPYSMEEIIARDFILGADCSQPPDAIINIVDATNIERNLYLTAQLLELERPMVVALNFMDEVGKKGCEINVSKLSKELGIPVVPITARTGENVDFLLHVAHSQMHIGYTIEPDDLYDDFTHEIHHRIGVLIHDEAHNVGLPSHWAAIKLLEGDGLVEKTLNLPVETKRHVAGIVQEYEDSSGLGDSETLVADSRYNYIVSILAGTVKWSARSRESLSDRIDKVVMHKVFAAPLFLAMMLIVFAFSFGLAGAFLSDGVAFLLDRFSEWLGGIFKVAEVAPWLSGLITDGIITGVGGVLTFLPQIAILFFFLSLLEDSGYMARAAFIMDRLLRHFGLSGKAFIPMLMGFGCTVPAIMGARTMENEKDRRMTMMLVPFMSCSARLPVYGLISAAFFGAWAGAAVFALYVLGLVLAIVSGIIFSRTVFKGQPAPFVMELPPYRVPSMKNTFIHVWTRLKGFLVRAGTIILLMSVVLWFLQSFDSSLRMVEDSSKSILAAIGGAIAPVFKPLGFGVWQASVALLTGFVAKEAVVASLSMFYGFALTATGAAVASAMTGFTPLSAFAFLVFILLYIPCVAAVSTLYKEMRSLKLTALTIGWQLSAAYVVSLVVYQVGRFFM